MPDIVLATLNARYIHASLALRTLAANMGELCARTVIREFIVGDRPIDIAEEILALKPRIVGLSVYVWNTSAILDVVRLLRRIAPTIKIVLGGPEVSYEINEQEICHRADFIITGEGETSFRTLCERLLTGRMVLTRVIAGEPPDLATLSSPYPLLSDHDVEKRVVYVEASRGCPFSCEFCLSSLDEKVRGFPLEKFLGELGGLIERGARQIKFIDRTFNLNLKTTEAILDFILARMRPDLFVHFEMIPDRFPPSLRERIAGFPPGSLQLEVGVQTFDEATSARVGRRQNVAKLEENLDFLASLDVHIHADLIVGLPGESLESFAAGFDRLLAIGPNEIQVGVLKRLRGTPIARHDTEWDMVWSETAPYEILANRLLDFATLTRMKRFARAWDLIGNSGNFRESRQLLWTQGSPFAGFLAFCDWLFARVGHFTGIALARLAELVFEFATTVVGVPTTQAASALAGDFSRPGRRLPPFLAQMAPARAVQRLTPAAGPERQRRHLA